MQAAAVQVCPCSKARALGLGTAGLVVGGVSQVTVCCSAQTLSISCQLAVNKQM
jgi:hypothetical protein